MPEDTHTDATEGTSQEESLAEQLVRVTRERDDERLLTKDLNQEILNLKLLTTKLQHEKEEVEVGMKEICEAKLAMSKTVAEANLELEHLRKKIVSLQMENLEQRDAIELLEQQLAQANRSERERYEEVKLQAQRLQQAEQDFEDLQRSMAQMRAPQPTVASSPGPHVPESPGQNKSFGLKEAGGWLKNLVNSKMNNQQPPTYPKPVQDTISSCKHNTRCADCDLIHPLWFSTGFGTFICTECAGIHRSFGTHVTTVRSLTLDNINHIQLLHACGNKCANDTYLAKLAAVPGDIGDSAKRVEFLRNKYIHKCFKKDEPLTCADCRKECTPEAGMNLVEEHGTLVCSDCCLIHEKTNQTGAIQEIHDPRQLQNLIVMSEAANSRLIHNKAEAGEVTEAYVRDKYINRKFSIACADCEGIDAQFFIPRYCVLVCAGCSHIHRSFDPEVEVIDVTKARTPIKIFNSEANAKLLPTPPPATPPKTDPSFRLYLVAKYKESRPLPTRTKCADCNVESAVPSGTRTISYNGTHGTFVCSRCSSLHQDIFGISTIQDVDLSLYDAEKNRQSNAQLLANLPDDFIMPNAKDEDGMREFIENKYKHQYVKNPDIPGSSWLTSTLTRLQHVAHNIFHSDSDQDFADDDEPVIIDSNILSVGSGELIPFTPKVFGYLKKRKPSEDEDEPTSPQVPTLRQLPESAVILSAAWRQLLCEKIPTKYETMDWVRTYCSSVDGGSLSSLYTACKHKGASILVVKTTDGEIFGGYSNEAWSHQPRYHGNGEVFVFKFKGASCEKWGWSSQNEYFMLSHRDTLAFGGGGGPAICIDATLGKGSSGHCETFESPPLTSHHDFTIQSLEVWNFSDEVGAE